VWPWAGRSPSINIIIIINIFNVFNVNYCKDQNIFVWLKGNDALRKERLHSTEWQMKNKKNSKGAHLSLLRQCQNMKGNYSSVHGETKRTK